MGSYSFRHNGDGHENIEGFNTKENRLSIVVKRPRETTAHYASPPPQKVAKRKIVVGAAWCFGVTGRNI